MGVVDLGLLRWKRGKVVDEMSKMPEFVHARGQLLLWSVNRSDNLTKRTLWNCKEPNEHNCIFMTLSRVVLDIPR